MGYNYYLNQPCEPAEQKDFNIATLNANKVNVTNSQLSLLKWLLFLIFIQSLVNTKYVKKASKRNISNTKKRASES
jgi:hypothetical protein